MFIFKKEGKDFVCSCSPQLVCIASTFYYLWVWSGESVWWWWWWWVVRPIIVLSLAKAEQFTFHKTESLIQSQLVCSVSFVTLLDSVMGWVEGDWRPVEQLGDIAHGQEHSHPLVEQRCLVTSSNISNNLKITTIYLLLQILSFLH